ncbi:MaoC family dehydratase N-terminal domain-containing protein [Micrococcus sp.]|uniref:MaoC family dehydratase N-terminal domain-containing protein n=1 Tax=Micrococcus sp. TaxID=1271 RepID=UPI002A920198|nr:MaoC family dehydratase N-terminal domain-containing protein [Micrococcus sp.]MDY6055607.1 MaoC family dehydratase N-terminal domain-containing protein [Micrococcus sp.]
MSDAESLAGREYPPAPTYQVGREAVRAFADAVQASHPAHRDVDAARALGHADLVAPPTFAVVVAQRAEAAVVADPEVGIDFSRVVHADERFTHHRPIVAGDELTGRVRVEAVKQLGGHRMVTTVTSIADAAGEPVSDVRSTLLVRGEES